MSAAWLSERTAALFNQGFEGQVAGDEPRLGIAWAQFSHLYLNYYTFQYALGLAAAQTLAGHPYTGGPSGG